MSRIAKNIRPPCGGYDNRIILSNCFSHFTQREAGVPVWVNTTRVPDWHIPPTASGIPPYSRNVFNDPPLPLCFPEPVCGTPDCVGCGTASCDRPTTASYLDCSGTEISNSIAHTKVFQGLLFNCFEETPQTKSFSSCRKDGFKQIFAKKMWHGRHGYRHRFPTSFGVAPDSATYCCACAYQAPTTSSDSTKYLKIEASSTFEVVGHDFLAGDFDASAEASSTVEVDRYKGTFNTATCVSSSNITGVSDPTQLATFQALYAGHALSMLTAANNYIDFIWTTYCGWYNYEVAGGEMGGQTGGGFGPPSSIAGSGTSYTLQWANNESFGYPGSQPDVVTVDLAAGTLTVDQYSIKTIAGVTTAYHSAHYEYAMGDTTFTYSSYYNAETTFDNGQVTETLTATLSETYTADEVKSDLALLLLEDKYPLGDDLLYPWRNDGRIGYGPILAYNEKGPTQPTTCATNGSTDWMFTGDILGIPHKNYWAPYFDGLYPNYEICSNDAYPEFGEYFITSWGAYSGDGMIPAAATKWTTRPEEQTRKA